MPAAAASPLARGDIQFLLKQAREIMFVLKASLHRDFFDGELSFSEKIASPNKPEFEQVLMRPEPRMGGKRATKPSVTDPEFARQKLHVQLARVFVLNAGDRRFDDIAVLSFPGGLRLLSRVKQPEEVRRGARKDLLQSRSVGANRLKHSAERRQYGVLGVDFENRIFGRNKTMPEPLAGGFTVKADPVFVPAAFRVGGVAMPDSGEKKKSVARLDRGGEFSFRFKMSSTAGNVNQRESFENPPVLPIERKAFRMAAGRIECVRRDAGFSRGRDVKPPVFVAAADWEITIE